MTSKRPLLAVTPGDITGVGPEILVRVLAEGPREDCRILVVADAGVMKAAYKALGVKFNLPIFKDADEAIAGKASMAILDLADGGEDILFLRKPHDKGGRLALEALIKASELAVAKKADGVVYAPLCKESLNYNGKKYGDEQYLLKEYLKAPSLRALAKIGNVFRITVVEHYALRKVPDMITKQAVLSNVETMHHALQAYGLKSPRIAVAALNPHASEHGMMGNEEAEEITPAIEAAQKKGINAVGPIPSDTVYVRAFKGQFDGVVNLYHDQSQIALKAFGFGEIVIFYVNGPIIITTPGHGTAYGKAGKGLADFKNMRQVVELAAALAARKK
jgi:4-hydroxy-L-threonine phosphate dehydrogenase PdxA